MSRSVTTLMNKAFFLTLVALGGQLVVPVAADAGSNTGTMAVTATIVTSCTLATNPLNFGSYDGANANAATALSVSTTVSVTCTPGSTPTIAMGPGVNATGTQRAMVKTGGTALLNYNLFQPSSTTPGAACGTAAWGDGTSATTGTTFTATTATSVAPRSYNVCGTIPAGQGQPTGGYTDTVTETVTF